MTTMKILNNGAVQIARGTRASDGAIYVLAMRPGGTGSEYVTWRVDRDEVGVDDDGEHLVTEGYDHGCYFPDIFSAAHSFNHRLGIICRVISEDMVTMARRLSSANETMTVEDTLSLADDLASMVMERGA